MTPMRSPTLKLALVSVLALAAPLALAAGEVQLSMKPADQLRDVGRGLDRARNVQALQARFQALAKRLQADEVLTIEVLDVDLAGEVLPVRAGEELRVLKGGADWPRLEFKWTLTRGTKTLASGHEHLADMNYLNEPLRPGQDGGLPYEGRMIERWFSERVAPTAAAARR